MDILFTLRHLIKAGHRNGHGVHSPNIYEFFEKAIFSKEVFNYSNAEESLKLFKQSKETILVTSAGAKGNGEKYQRRVADIAKSSSSYGKYGRLLQRIASYLHPDHILELGTSLGIGTIYMASGSPLSLVTTVEACPETSKTAERNFKRIGIDNIIPKVSNFDDIIQQLITPGRFGLIYVDGNHTYEATMRYYNIIEQAADGGECVAIFDDINWSRGMAKAWYEICEKPGTIVAIETMRMGIVFFNKKLTKNIYVTRF
ncbi:MAG: class I SAM-dependent methyltransferase [Bacteroidales bacterium]|nr:class I SAM-dependent methyltransferase [Bacteroidales bacterium]